MSAKMSKLGWTAYLLVILGSFNWGVFGLTSMLGKPYDFIRAMVTHELLSNIIFISIGIAGMYSIYAIAQK